MKQPVDPNSLSLPVSLGRRVSRTARYHAIAIGRSTQRLRQIASASGVLAPVRALMNWLLGLGSRLLSMSAPEPVEGDRGAALSSTKPRLRRSTAAFPGGIAGEGDEHERGSAFWALHEHSARNRQSAWIFAAITASLAMLLLFLHPTRYLRPAKKLALKATTIVHDAKGIIVHKIRHKPELKKPADSLRQTDPDVKVALTDRESSHKRHEKSQSELGTDRSFSDSGPAETTLKVDKPPSLTSTDNPGPQFDPPSDPRSTRGLDAPMSVAQNDRPVPGPSDAPNDTPHPKTSSLDAGGPSLGPAASPATHPLDKLSDPPPIEPAPRQAEPAVTGGTGSVSDGVAPPEDSPRALARRRKRKHAEKTAANDAIDSHSDQDFKPTEPDKPLSDKSSPDKSLPDKPGLDGPSADKASPNKFSFEKSAENKLPQQKSTAGPDLFGPERSADKSNDSRTLTDKLPGERPSTGASSLSGGAGTSEKTPTDGPLSKPVPDFGGSDKGALDKGAVNNAAPTNSPSEAPPVGKSPFDVPASTKSIDKPSAGVSFSDPPASDKPLNDKASSDKSPLRDSSRDKLAPDKPDFEKLPPDKSPPDKSPPDKSALDRLPASDPEPRKPLPESALGAPSDLDKKSDIAKSPVAPIEFAPTKPSGGPPGAAETSPAMPHEPASDHLAGANLTFSRGPAEKVGSGPALAYKIVVRNNGAKAVSVVEVEEAVPADHVVQSVDPPADSPAGSDTLHWTLKSLSPHEERAIVITMTPPERKEPPARSPIAEAAPMPAADQAPDSFSPKVIPQKAHEASMQLELIAPATLAAGETCRIGFRATNLGPQTAGLKVYLDLPEELHYSKGQRLQCVIGKLEQNQSREDYLTAIAGSAGEVKLHGEIITSQGSIAAADATIRIAPKNAGKSVRRTSQQRVTPASATEPSPATAADCICNP